MCSTIQAKDWFGETYCEKKSYCQMPNNGMVLCSVCSKWFHKQCIAERVGDNPKEKWFCSVCRSLPLDH